MGAALRLYEIADALEEINDSLVENGGEITPEIEAKLNALEYAFGDKVDRIAMLITINERQAEMAAAEVTRLKKLATSRTNTATALRNYLGRVLKQAGRDKLDTNRFSLRIQRAGKPTIGFVGATIPTRFRRTKVELDKTLALEEYNAKGKLPKGFTVTITESLIIR